MTAFIFIVGVVEYLIVSGGDTDELAARADCHITHFRLSGDSLGYIDNMLTYFTVGTEQMTVFGTPGSFGAAIYPAIIHKNHICYSAFTSVDRPLRTVRDEIVTKLQGEKGQKEYLKTILKYIFSTRLTAFITILVIGFSSLLVLSRDSLPISTWDQAMALGIGLAVLTDEQLLSKIK